MPEEITNQPDATAEPPSVPMAEVPPTGGVTAGEPAPPALPARPPAVVPGAPQAQAPIVAEPPTPGTAPEYAAQGQHYSALGRIGRALIGNNVRYEVGPDGTERTVTEPAKPGDFFRKLVAGALIGAMAGAHEPTFARGAAAGGGAAVLHGEQQDKEAHELAQKGFERRQAAQRTQMEQQRLNLETTREAREKQLADAQIAHLHSEQLALDKRTDLLDKEYVDKHNAGVTALENTIKDAGGTPSGLVVDGQSRSTLTGDALMRAITKDPSAMQGPQGYHRVFLSTTDTSELTYNGTQWVDASGKPVNMSDKTTIKVYDVPEDALKKPVMVTGKDIMAAYGQKIPNIDPDKKYPVSPLQMAAMNAQRLKDEKEASITDLNKKKAQLEINQIGLETARIKALGERGDKDAAVEALKAQTTRINSLETEMKSAASNFDTEAMKTLRTQLDKARKDSEELETQIRQGTRFAKPGAGAGGAGTGSESKLGPKAAIDAATEVKKAADGLLQRMSFGAAQDAVGDMRRSGKITAAEADAIQQEIRARAAEDAQKNREVLKGLASSVIK